MADEMTDELSIDKVRAELFFDRTQHVFHCDYFNLFWQRTIERAEAVNGKAILRDSVGDYIYNEFSILFEEREMDEDRRREFAEEFFKTVAAMGIVDLSGDIEGGSEITVNNSHFGSACVDFFGDQDTPQCTYWEGALEGIIAAIKDGDRDDYEVRESKCLALGDDSCAFEVTE